MFFKLFYILVGVYLLFVLENIELDRKYKLVRNLGLVF